MIAKMIKGRGFRGALEYDLKKEKGRVLDGNMAGRNPRELAAEFGEIRKLRPNLGKAVLHVSLSAAIGEKLTDDQWCAIGKRYLRGMGFKDNQFLITRHTDTEHEHIHILANRITTAGEVVSDGQDYQRQETIMREIELEYGLQRVVPSRESERRAPTKGEIEQGIRTGRPSTRQCLQQLCDAAAQDCHSFTDYLERLEAVGVEVIPTVQKGGARLSGIQYRLDGVIMKGSDLGKIYAAAGIQKRGIIYEQDRDFAAVSRSLEREATRGAGRPDRGDEASQKPERGGIGHDAGTPGAVNGSPGRRNAEDVDRDRPHEPGAGQDVQTAASGLGEELQRRGSSSEQGRRESEPSREPDGLDSLQFGPSDWTGDSGACERILSLAGTDAECSEHAGSTGSRQFSETRHDRSLEAIRRQVEALGSSHFDIEIREVRSGQVIRRLWTRPQLEQSTKWLKRMNARGNDIFIRPAGDHGLVLVKDLKAENLQRMKADGFAPAAILEVGLGTYQAWVKLSDQALFAGVRQLAEQDLAKKYGAQKKGDSCGYGRLAGFTNQNVEYIRDGRQPYVLARDCTGLIADTAFAYLERIDRYRDRIAVQEARNNRLKLIEIVKRNHAQRDPVQDYRLLAQSLMQQNRTGESDFSRMDWIIATDMAKSGYWTEQDIARALAEASPNMESHKVEHIEDYARRMAEKAWNVPEVQAIRSKQSSERQVVSRSRHRDGPGLG